MQKYLFFLFIFLAACQLEPISQLHVPQSLDDVQKEDTWQTLATGLEQHSYQVNLTRLSALRIDPNYYEFRVHYHPHQPLSIQEWREELSDAAIIVNANFFASDNTILGLLISDGLHFGQSYIDRGGTFFVDNSKLGIRSNIEQPYQGESYEQAVQGFPILVLNGIQAYTNSRDNSVSRRSIIAQDTQGRIIIMTSSAFGISLYNLSEFLANSDMNIVTALNLDGGRSTMLYVAALDSYILSFDPVPAVLAVYPK